MEDAVRGGIMSYIIAAPDLLGALEHSIVALEYIAGELRDLGEEEDADMMERQAQENHAAIAKARGE
jgi:hypothetical protein